MAHKVRASAPRLRLDTMLRELGARTTEKPVPGAKADGHTAKSEGHDPTATRDAATARNDVATARRDAATATSDVATARNDAATATRDAATATNDAATATNDAATATRDAATATRDAATATRDAATATNDAASATRDPATATNDAATYAATTTSHDATTATHDAAAARHDAATAKHDAATATHDAAAAMHDNRPLAITVGELVDKAAQSGFGFLIAVLALVAIPFFGMSTPFGLAIALVGFQLFIGRERPWLPNRARKRRLKMTMLDRILGMVNKRMRWLAASTRKRWEPMVRPRLVGFGVVLLGLGLALPLPIPGSNMIFIVPVLVYAIGLLEGDGMWIVIGHLATLVDLALLIAFGATVVAVLSSAWSYVF